MAEPHIEATSLANWRTAPFNRSSFSRVREIIPTGNITCSPGGVDPLPRSTRNLAALAIKSPLGSQTTLADFIDNTATDALMVLRRGAVVYEWYRTPAAQAAPHIVFSVSKSITAILAGVLHGDGVLDPDAPVTSYIPEAHGSAYADATVRHVLDMTVSLSFIEDYINPDATFLRYRAASGFNPRPAGSDLTLQKFLVTLEKDRHQHGEIFRYQSPNSDMLGWIIERAGRKRFHELLSERIWQPMGAAADAYVTLDPAGAPRTAGGICVTIGDLARFGEMLRNRGAAGGRQIVPGAWIDDIRFGGSTEPWLKGDMRNFMPVCRYRSKWYNRTDADSFMAVGIHGQWLAIDHSADLVIAKQSSQALPVEDRVDHLHLAAFDALAQELK